MGRVERLSLYFEAPGFENTGDVVEAVSRRLREGDVKTVVVASTSGRTGARFAEAMTGEARVVAVSHRRMDPRLKDAIVRLGGVAVDETHLPLHGSSMDAVRRTLYTLGQGFKVAVEVILIAADKELIDPYQDVVGVGGSGGGADTALVARSTRTGEIFAGDRSKKLEVREVLAMPLQKKWW